MKREKNDDPPGGGDSYIYICASFCPHRNQSPIAAFLMQIQLLSRRIKRVRSLRVMLTISVSAGVNTGWGVIALLETDQSTASSDGVLQMLGNVGTVLQQDTGSWVHGSGIALQNYADGNVTHYFTVNEQGDDDEITSYSLRYYSTIVNDKAERESNESPGDGGTFFVYEFRSAFFG